MEIHLRTLTPLWTGGVDQSCDRLHGTGLIGSLRWWYEALVRGLGGYACDPTAERRCEYDPKKPAPPEKQLCAACYLFGCTGWARKFRLSVSSEGKKLFDNKQDILIPSGRKYQTKKGERAGGWFVFSESRIKDVKLTLTSLREADLRSLHLVLALISRHASLGPKGASGYGVIQADVNPQLDWMQVFGNQPPARNSTLPDFRDFFFARFQFEEPSDNPNWWQDINGIRQAINRKLDDGSSPPPLRKAQQELAQMKQQGILPIAPAIRNWLRYHWQHGLNYDLERYVFGDARSAIGSKILVSYAYRFDSHWEFRIWGWLPCGGQLNNRDGFLNTLKSVLQGQAGGDIWKFVFGKNGNFPTMVEWHALKCDQTDGQQYLSELFGGAQ